MKFPPLFPLLLILCGCAPVPMISRSAADKAGASSTVQLRSSSALVTIQALGQDPISIPAGRAAFFVAFENISGHPIRFGVDNLRATSPRGPLPIDSEETMERAFRRIPPAGARDIGFYAGTISYPPALATTRAPLRTALVPPGRTHSGFFLTRKAPGIRLVIQVDGTSFHADFQTGRP